MNDAEQRGLIGCVLFFMFLTAFWSITLFLLASSLWEQIKPFLESFKF